MVAIHLAGGIRGAVIKEGVELRDLVAPLAVRADLALGEHEALARAEAAPDFVVAALGAHCECEAIKEGQDASSKRTAMVMLLWRSGIRSRYVI
jgi:hypothetical protein